MNERQERKAGAAATETRGEWAEPEVKRLVSGAAEGSPANTTDNDFPS